MRFAYGFDHIMVWGQIDAEYIYGFHDTEFRGTKYIPYEEFDDTEILTYTNAIRQFRARDLIYGVRIKPGKQATRKEKDSVESQLRRLCKKYNMGPCKLDYFVALRACEIEFEQTHSLYDVSVDYKESELIEGEDGPKRTRVSLADSESDE